MSLCEVSSRCWQMNSSTGNPCSRPGEAQETEDHYNDDDDDGGNGDDDDDDDDDDGGNGDDVDGHTYCKDRVGVDGHVGHPGGHRPHVQPYLDHHLVSNVVITTIITTVIISIKQKITLKTIAIMTKTIIAQYRRPGYQHGKCKVLHQSTRLQE